ncbi:MAG: hypothetical protein QNK40_01650 [Desulfobacterales bacterium]|nr:hypothetical protein [Desulfobacterales bacterium]
MISLDGSDLGYQGTVDTYDTGSPTMRILNNWQEYYNADLYIETLVRIDSHDEAYHRTNKVIISFSSSEEIQYLAQLRLDYYNVQTPIMDLFLSVHNNGPPDHDQILVSTPVSIDFDTFYKMVIQIDSDQFMNVSVYDMDGALLGNVSSPKVLSANFGAIAIGGRYKTTFNDFSLTGNSAQYVFKDDFDYPGYTLQHWMFTYPLWSFHELDLNSDPVNLGLRGKYDENIGDDAMAIVEKGIRVSTQNVFLKTGIMVLNKEIIEPGTTTPKDQGGGLYIFDLCSNTGIHSSLFYSYGEDIWIHSAGGVEEDNDVEVFVNNIEFDRMYYLDLSTNSNNKVSSTLIDDQGNIISTISDVPIFGPEWGIAGVYSQSDAVFDNFILNSSAAPVKACFADFNQDGDVDGEDLSTAIITYPNATVNDIASFAQDFGKTNCPNCYAPDDPDEDGTPSDGDFSGI